MCSFDYMHMVSCLSKLDLESQGSSFIFRPPEPFVLECWLGSMKDVFVETADSQNVKNIEGAHITKHSINCSVCKH